MAESKHWQIAEALRAAFAAIAGDDGTTYWYSVDEAVQVQEYTDAMDSSLESVVLIKSGEETHDEYSTGTAADGGVIRAFAEFFVLLVRHHPRASHRPFNEPTPTRAQVTDRTVRDFVRVLFADVTLGGLARNVSSSSVIVDRDLGGEGLESWSLAEARFLVEYEYFASAP